MIIIFFQYYATFPYYISIFSKAKLMEAVYDRSLLEAKKVHSIFGILTLRRSFLNSKGGILLFTAVFPPLHWMSWHLVVQMEKSMFTMLDTMKR